MFTYKKILTVIILALWGAGTGYAWSKGAALGAFSAVFGGVFAMALIESIDQSK